MLGVHAYVMCPYCGESAFELRTNIRDDNNMVIECANCRQEIAQFSRYALEEVEEEKGKK